jgi:hypothetical protein
MAEPDKKPVTLEELLVSSLAQTDALGKLLIEKGLITREEFLRRFPKNGRRIRSCLIQRSSELSPQRLFEISSNLFSVDFRAKRTNHAAQT